jgi:hypothetical protein
MLVCAVVFCAPDGYACIGILNEKPIWGRKETANAFSISRARHFCRLCRGKKNRRKVQRAVVSCVAALLHWLRVVAVIEFPDCLAYPKTFLRLQTN